MHPTLVVPDLFLGSYCKDTTAVEMVLPRLKNIDTYNVVGLIMQQKLGTRNPSLAWDRNHRYSLEFRTWSVWVYLNNLELSEKESAREI